MTITAMLAVMPFSYSWQSDQCEYRSIAAISQRAVRETGDITLELFSLGYVTAEQLNRMLPEPGISIIHQYGNWDKGPLGEDQPEIISMCRLAAGLR